ncbi:hypothetical protein [Clostridium sp.]
MKNVKKITSILMAASITMILFSACSSKTADTTSTTTETTAVTTDASKTADNKRNDPTAMKTTYTNVLRALVTDSTITQVQSDKVLAIVVKEPTDGEKPTGTPPTDGEKPSGTPPTDGSKPNDTNSADERKPKGDRLSELVTSKVITQAQADTINEKVQAAMESVQATTAK